MWGMCFDFCQKSDYSTYILSTFVGICYTDLPISFSSLKNVNMDFPRIVDTDVQKQKDKSMSRKPHYDEEFKKNTIELLIKSRKSMTEISKDFGILAKLEEEVSDGCRSVPRRTLSRE